MALRVPHVDIRPLTEEARAIQHAKRAARAVGRLFRGQWSKEAVAKSDSGPIISVDSHTLELDRMDAALAILAWSNAEGGEQGISTNAVDDDGRTGRHLFVQQDLR